MELKKNIFRPVKTYSPKPQRFGESKACINNQRKVIAKTNNTCPPGYTSLYETMGMDGHNGDDFSLWSGEPIFFPVSLDVKWWAKTEVDFAGGIGVDVISREKVLVKDYGQLGLVKNQADGYYGYIKVRFWHLKKVNVYDGENVKFGDLIGWGDNTGLSSGDHLHWSMKMCDENGRGINKNNRYYGAMDMKDFYDDKFCLEILQIKYQLSLIELIIKLLFKTKRWIK